MEKRIAALVLAACMALPLFGCGSKLTAQSLTEGVTARTIDTHIDLTDDSTAVMDFAAALLRQTTKEEGVLLSPVSLLYALGMTANGAGGTTLSQLEKAMGMDRDTLNDYLYTYRMSLPENTKKCKLSLANSLWVRDIFRVEDSFLDNCVSYYDAEVYRSAFDEAMKNDLNHWVSNQTDGMIDKLLEQAPSERTMLYLVNAVCFDAKWKKPYEKDDIQKGAVFTAADGTRQTADLLWSQESLYLSDDNTTGFMKYYDGGRYAFVGLLPNEGVSITDYVAGLTGGKLHALLNDPQHGTVEAAIPCPSQPEGWPEAERARWQSLVDRCDYETVVQDHYDAGCMQRRNRYMVDHAAMLIAVHDGQPGGTRRTIEYAMRRRLDVVILPPVENEKETTGL